MWKNRLSLTGSLMVVTYAVFFAYAVWTTVDSCPAFLCSLLLLVSTIPWSLIFEPQFNVFDLARPATQSGLLSVSFVFFLANSALLYLAGYQIGRFCARWKTHRT